MNRIILKRLIFFIILLLLQSCGKNKPEYIARKVVPYVKKKVSDKEAEKKPKKYVYPGKNRRNPFIAPGFMAVGPVTGTAGLDLASLELKGIIISPDRNERYALISGAGGEGYIVKNGKLINLNNQVVKGITGTIKADRVILVTKKHQMRVLKIVRAINKISGFKKEKTEEK